MDNRIRSKFALYFVTSAFLFACGNSNGGGAIAPPPAEFTSSNGVGSVPSYGLSSVEVSTADATPPASSVIDRGGITSGAMQAANPVVDDPCHPALFQRTSEIASRLNFHTNKMMSRILGIINHPRARDNSPNCTVDDKTNPTKVSCTIDPSSGMFSGYPLTLTWQKSLVSSGTQYVTDVYIQPSSTTAAHLHQCELGASPLPAACTNIFTSTLTESKTGSVTDMAGTLHFDFTALNSVDSNERATGTFDVNTDYTRDPSKPNSVRKVLGFTFTNFIPELTAQEIAAGEKNHGARSGVMAHLGYTGSPSGGGGALEFVDEVILFCPQYGSPAALNSTLYSDAATVGRWYRAVDTSSNVLTLHARTDAEAVGDSGGASPNGGAAPTGNAQLPAGVTYTGAACYNAAAAGAPTTTGDLNSWEFKEETASAGSTTVSGYVCGPKSGGSCVNTCDAAFGALPDGTTANDFAFGITPNVTSSGIPSDTATIIKDLKPLLSGTQIGSAWTD